MADMHGQVALVTGGIRGIGLAICERLMNRGVTVAAGYASNAGFRRALHWLPSAPRGPVERALDRYETAIAELYGA